MSAGPGVWPALWPWLAVAAAGALHGANPAAGWAIAAWRARSGGRGQLLPVLWPIAVGHAVAVLVVAAAVPLALRFGAEYDPHVPQALGAAVLLAMVVRHLRRGAHHAPPRAAHAAGIAVWSFIVGTAHGAGWMLVPALVPLCAGDMPAKEIVASGSVVLGLAAVCVHLAAMLVTTAVIAVAAAAAAATRTPPRGQR